MSTAEMHGRYMHVLEWSVQEHHTVLPVHLSLPVLTMSV